MLGLIGVDQRQRRTQRARTAVCKRMAHLEELAAFVQDGDGAGLAGIDAEDSHALNILVDSKVRTAIEDAATLEPAGDFFLKGLHRAVPAFYLHAIT
jgi:class 3 adenylate cyclase